MEKLSSLSIVFPTFNDEQSIPLLVQKALKVLPSISNEYEIIIVNDGSYDKTAEVLADLKKKIPFLTVVTHRNNKGYGITLRDGFKNAKYDFIFYTDSDGQYDVSELEKLVAEFDNKTDLVTGFKLNRADPWVRHLTGYLYNQLVKFLFNLKIRDVDCDFRLFRRKILKGLKLKTTGGAFDAEFIKKLQNNHIRFKEIGIHHYPRLFGQSQFFRPSRVLKSLWELGHI